MHINTRSGDIFHRNYHKQTFNSIIEFTACSQTKRKSLHARILIEKFAFREMAAKQEGALPIKSSFRVTRTSGASKLLHQIMFDDI